MRVTNVLGLKETKPDQEYFPWKCTLGLASRRPGISNAGVPAFKCTRPPCLRRRCDTSAEGPCGWYEGSLDRCAHADIHMRSNLRHEGKKKKKKKQEKTPWVADKSDDNRSRRTSIHGIVNSGHATFVKLDLSMQIIMSSSHILSLGKLSWLNLLESHDGPAVLTHFSHGPHRSVSLPPRAPSPQRLR